MEISHANFWALAQPSDESMHLIKDGAMIVEYGRSIKEDLRG